MNIPTAFICEFKLSQALQKTGVAHCEEIEVPQVDHFNLAENLRDPGYELTQV